MGIRKSNLIIRLIAAVIAIGVIIALALRWSSPDTRDGVFYYFVILMIYAAVMLFFSDIIFLGKRPIHARIPVTTVAAIHIVYLLVVLLFRFILSIVPNFYYILLTLVATGVQVALSLWIYRGVLNITGQQEVLQQQKGVKVGRDILMADLTACVKKIPDLAQDDEIMRKLEVFSNAWKYSPQKENEHSYPLTAEIDNRIYALIGSLNEGKTGAEALTGELSDITSIIERRKKLLQIR